MKMEAEIEVMWPQAKEHQGVSATPEVKRKAWTLPPSQPPEKTNPANTSISDL